MSALGFALPSPCAEKIRWGIANLELGPGLGPILMLAPNTKGLQLVN
jgi:hypothetical protein